MRRIYRMSLRVRLALVCLGFSQTAFAATIPPVLKSQEIAEFGSCHLLKDKMYTPYVAFLVDTMGRPQKVHVVETSGNACADRSAVKAIAQYSFEPARKNGKPVSFPYQLGLPMMDVGKSSF